MTAYGETNCSECRGTNYGHYSHCSKYGGEKKGHKHAALMAQYAQDAAETDKPWERWEFRPYGPENWIKGTSDFCFYSDCEYRRKPRTLTYTVTIPEPLRTAPPVDQRYFLALPEAWSYFGESRWCGDSLEREWLKRGLCFATKEDAIAAAKAMLPIKGDGA